MQTITKFLTKAGMPKGVIGKPDQHGWVEVMNHALDALRGTECEARVNEAINDGEVETCVEGQSVSFRIKQ